MTSKIRETILGRPKSPLEPGVFERLSLVAFLAWVGLGADGLSSACYGPEEAFRALGEHRWLAPYLALATMATVSVLSAAYAYTVEAFPSGGGGYVVATRSLGRTAGMLCGCALLIDYVLTVAISIAASTDAVFSMLPAALHPYEFYATLAGAFVLMFLNLRGVRESVVVLLPVFLLFLVTHALLIAWALLGGTEGTPAPAPAPATAASAGIGALGAVVLLVKAYSHGAGTYTGIEAISNSLQILREPRVQTARRAMLYMAISLSVVAGGLLISYLVTGAQPAEGETLNAVLARRVLGAGAVGKLLVLLTLLSEAALLLVAAQAGFIAGPRSLASMAIDFWVPRWFSHLSDRLVVSNGVLIMGVGGLLAILLTRGNVATLVVIYSFSVFVTFLLSQAGMTRFWTRRRPDGWLRRAAISACAALLSALVLAALLWTHGVGPAGIAAATILVVAALLVAVKAHYRSVQHMLQRLESLKDAVAHDPYRADAPPLDAKAPTAVVLVSGYNGLGLHLLLAVHRLFPKHFHQFVFLSVGVVDFDSFKGEHEVASLKESVQTGLAGYAEVVTRWGYAADTRWAVGVDVVDEMERLCAEVGREYPRAVFFCGDLIYQIPSVLTRLLHSRTAHEIQRRLHLLGLPLLVVPVRATAE